MLDNKLQKTLFHLTSVATTWFPRGGAWFFDHTIPPILGNKLLVKHIFEKNLRTVRAVPRFKKILVIPDIHIGDAVMMQGAVQAFRDYFPDARVDYVIKKSIACLIEGNPAISNLYPLFTGSVFPTENDVDSIKKLVAENQYDLCFNCSPFFEDDRLFPPGQKILNFLTGAPQLARNDIDQVSLNHFLFQSYMFVDKLLQKTTGAYPRKAFPGVPVTLSDDAFEKARALIVEKKVPGDKPIVFINPDTASPYTLIPFEHQATLLKRMLEMDATVLFGTAFVHKEVEKKLLENLSEDEKRNVVVIPCSLPIDAYAALVDFADVFVSGDTGPLHIAAARKFSKTGNVKFRNKTFVISVFGATPARMSGYDSTNPLFPPANQDVISRTYVSQSPCRNITCVNKMAKTCEKVRCFEVLDVEGIVGDIKRHLEKSRTPAA
ncbi:MAG TPA: glycosyltransferase family 9 protein [bacterium]|jgi:heptosyltransferase-1|nr:glycosyltransferase family 9 protein [bacterium]